MSLHASKLTIKNVIGRSFVLSTIAILAISIVGALYFNDQSIKIMEENNLQKTHEALSNFLVPAINIADITEVKRTLSLASDPNQFFSVINNSGDILLPDYSYIRLAESIYNNKMPSCTNVKTGYHLIKGEKYWVTCSTLTTSTLNQKKSVGILISFSKHKWILLNSLIFYFIGIILISLLLIIIWFRIVLHKRLLKPLIRLQEQIVAASKSPRDSTLHVDDIHKSPQEIIAIKDSFLMVLSDLKIQYA